MNNKMISIIASTVFILLILAANPCFSLDLDFLDDLNYPQAEKTISMDFMNANLNDVLKMFSQQSGLNFIAATDVAAKKVNLYLDNVPVEEALERILSANNLTYEIDPGSNIFVVKEMKTSSKQLMTRVYPLKFATVPSSSLNDTLTSDDQTSEEESVDLSSMGIIGAVKAVLTGDGSVIEDSRTNSIIVSDIPSQFPIIEQTVARLDVRIPQVLIETEMLDISKGTADLLGAKFGNTPMSFTGPTRYTLFPLDQNRAIRDLTKSGGQGLDFAETEPKREYEVGTLSFEGLSVALQFLRTKTDTKNLARPRILTLNNETAEIFIKTDEAIGLSSSTTASEGTATSVAEAERVETGVFLKVTPQANVATREITMAIVPKVIQAKRSDEEFGGQTFKNPEERGSKSILRVRDGDTIVLGGLLRTNLDETRTQVPVLGKVPVLGAAFRHKNKAESQRELIIFITPHIVTEDIPSIASNRNQNLLREQSIPMDRGNAIDKELSSVEETKFSSYR